MLHDIIQCFQRVLDGRGFSMQHGRDMLENLSRPVSKRILGGEIRCAQKKFDVA
jgi:hypothetical protein